MASPVGMEDSTIYPEPLPENANAMSIEAAISTMAPGTVEVLAILYKTGLHEIVMPQQAS